MPKRKDLSARNSHSNEINMENDAFSNDEPHNPSRLNIKRSKSSLVIIKKPQLSKNNGIEHNSETSNAFDETLNMPSKRPDSAPNSKDSSHSSKITARVNNSRQAKLKNICYTEKNTPKLRKRPPPKSSKKKRAKNNSESLDISSSSEIASSSKESSVEKNQTKNVRLKRKNDSKGTKENSRKPKSLASRSSVATNHDFELNNGPQYSYDMEDEAYGDESDDTSETSSFLDKFSRSNSDKPSTSNRQGWNELWESSEESSAEMVEPINSPPLKQTSIKSKLLADKNEKRVEMFSSKPIDSIHLSFLNLFLQTPAKTDGCEIVSYELDPNNSQLLKVEYKSAIQKQRALKKKKFYFKQYVLYAYDPLRIEDYAKQKNVIILQNLPTTRDDELIKTYCEYITVNEKKMHNVVKDIACSEIFENTFYVTYESDIDWNICLANSKNVSPDIQQIKISPAFITNAVVFKSLDASELSVDWESFDSYFNSLTPSCTSVRQSKHYTYVTYNVRDNIANILNNTHQISNKRIKVEYLFNFELLTSEPSKKTSRSQVSTNLQLPIRNENTTRTQVNHIYGHLDIFTAPSSSSIPNTQEILESKEEIVFLN